MAEKNSKEEENKINNLESKQQQLAALRQFKDELARLIAQAQKAISNIEMQNTNPKWSATGPHFVVLGETATVSVCRDGDTNTCMEDASPPSCVLVSREKCEVTSCTGAQGNQHEISCTPPIQGLFELHITVDGRHIRNSPFPVRVLGAPSKIIRCKSPQGIAFLKNGSIVVPLYEGNCFFIFTKTGTIDYEEQGPFGSQGNGKGKFERPCGAAVDGDDNIFVADSKNNRIQKFTPQGQFIQQVGGEGSPVTFQVPIGVRIHPQTGHIYVTEQEGHRVQILDKDLNSHFVGKGKGKEKGEFNNPKDVAFHSNGDVYVVDNENHRIQVFTADKKFKNQFGNRENTGGKRDGELYYPTAICIDDNNIVYVTDLHHCVSVFTDEGTFLTSFGSEGNEPGQFKNPRGIAIDRNGVIYVSDQGNDRVQLFT